jgi:uncharacterized protein (TIGR02996 family)
MSERDHFLQMIAENPDDDTARLVFADWLDEHDDPLGEFIRLQIELEPLRIPCDDPKLEHERIKRLNKIPPGEDQSRDDWPLAEKLNREEELLEKYKNQWLKGFFDHFDVRQSEFDIEFRRGFPESVQIELSNLYPIVDHLLSKCPTVQRIILFGQLRDRSDLLIWPCLRRVPEIVLAGWLSRDNILEMVGSRDLVGLKSLTVWMGSEEDGLIPSLSRLHGLKKLTLVQLWGGIEPPNAETLNQNADSLVAQIRSLNPELQVHLERPFTRRFPLDGIYIRHGIDAGYLPNGQAVLVEESRQPVIMYFDDDGRLFREEQLDLNNKLSQPSQKVPEDWNSQELIEVLGKEIGFQPGPIFVREFDSSLCEVALHWCWFFSEELRQPNRIAPQEIENVAALIYRHWKTDQFSLPFDNYYGIDGLGRIHSS